MNNDDSAYIFRGCSHRLNGHYTATPQAELERLSSEVDASESADRYGSGPIIEEFERTIAHTLGKEAALFLPSGTMAQVIALRIHCDEKKNRRFAMHPTSHLELHELQAYRELYGLEAEIVGNFDALLSLKQLKDIQTPIAALLIELPQRESGGLLPTWAELVEITGWAKEQGIRLHLDGARLWECKPYYTKEYAEICALFDSVYVSFYKSLGGIAGAVLAGTPDLIREAKVWQRRQGGNLISLYPYVLSARHVFRTRLDKMQAYVRKAKEIAELLSRFPEVSVVPQRPETNLFHLRFRQDPARLEAASLEVAKTERVALFRALQRDSTGRGVMEISIGDAALDLPSNRIESLFRALFSLAAEQVTSGARSGD